MAPACRRANASQYLVKTGLGCSGISVLKRTMHMPFQTVGTCVQLLLVMLVPAHRASLHRRA